MSTSRDGHPGPYIRANVLPKGVSVTEAARLLGVGRPALSNLLNGKAALSGEMAKRLEDAFGANARQLIDMQAAYDAAIARDKGTSASTKSYVPPFLGFKANAIQEWATSSITARSRLAVLLRTLVHSTGRQIRMASFPGNDDSERSGWDGLIDSDEATPWIPTGRSGWEFGVNSDIKRKADSDYKKSVEHVLATERVEIVFVFVTPRRWPTKSTWEAERRQEKRWRDVRVYDSSDLEQWLEQSIPAQVWLANELGIPAHGVLSLDACWGKFAADCTPPLIPALFDEAVSVASNLILAKLSKDDPQSVVITADSRTEALAFLHCVFSGDQPQQALLRDRIVVFSESGAFARLASRSVNFIPVVISRSVEQELAPHRADFHSILVYPKNATNADADVILEPLSFSAFEKSLQQMGQGRDDIERLSRESGRSLTVLRRRLAGLEAIRTPEWASDSGRSRALIPFLFAGSWKASNPADQVVLSLLADAVSYPEMESRLADLLNLEDSPLWSIESSRGLVSAIDVLFAIHRSITPQDLRRFFDVAYLVLSEDDPSLDLPEEKRWLAGAFGKTREISAPLRDGMSQTLVLLAVHGSALLASRLGVDPEILARNLVRELLSPLTVRMLEGHSHDLPMYAEASPDEFLAILERDLMSSDPEALKLMRPVSSAGFGGCPRTGLLWALEGTAWDPEYLVRTVEVLARLAKRTIEDNWANKPSASLRSIFLCWLPQTGANLDERLRALEYLTKRHPEVAWDLCVQQFDVGSTVGHYSHKPRWRRGVRGYGVPVTHGEVRAFCLRSLELALEWSVHTRDTLSDLIQRLPIMQDRHQVAVWNLVDQWKEVASEEDRASLREVVRRRVFTRRAKSQMKGNGNWNAAVIERARRAYAALKPKDLILEHAWLFEKRWVAESLDEVAEMVDEKLSYQERQERITTKRLEALREIIAAHGLAGAMALAGRGEAAGIVGWLLFRLIEDTEQRLNAIHEIFSFEPGRQLIIAGALGALGHDELHTILTGLAARLRAEEMKSILLQSPFGRVTWSCAEAVHGATVHEYWREVRPSWRCADEDIGVAIDHMLAVDRPRAAYDLVAGSVEHVQPKQLFRLMTALATNSSEGNGPRHIESFRVSEIFSALNDSGEISMGEMARLEFQYLDVLDGVRGNIPNLELQIEENPGLFVQAIALIYRRDDGAEDPEPFRELSREDAERRAHGAYRLLDRLSRIPGRNLQGEVDPDRLLHWVNQVRSSCSELAREGVCDSHLGQLLSKAPIGGDGIWPCEPVRKVIEQVVSDRFSRGIETGLYNSRGVHYRAEGGADERRLASQYAGWARDLELEYPRVAKILKDVARTYEHEAAREDAESSIRKRLS